MDFGDGIVCISYVQYTVEVRWFSFGNKKLHFFFVYVYHASLYLSGDRRSKTTRSLCIDTNGYRTDIPSNVLTADKIVVLFIKTRNNFID